MRHPGKKSIRLGYNWNYFLSHEGDSFRRDLRILNTECIETFVLASSRTLIRTKVEEGQRPIFPELITLHLNPKILVPGL